MSSLSPEPAVFTSSQRHCHLLLLLYLPEAVITLDSLCQLNRVSQAITRQDIAEVGSEIQRYHRLLLIEGEEDSYRIDGAELDQRLCLLHWLRRALRLSPDFVLNQFAGAVKQQLKALRIEKALFDERNLAALVQHCSHQLNRPYSGRDCQFLQLFMQYSLCRQVCTDFTEPQCQWLIARAEHQVAEEVVRHWQKRSKTPPAPSEVYLLSLLFSQVCTPTAAAVTHQHEQALLEAVSELTERFQHLSGMHFSNQEAVCGQLYTHLAQALERALFGIGIDNTLTDEVARLYPRLLRTTQAAVADFEQRYHLTFSPAEMGLIAIIFGAWLMQESALQEKQVLLLTSSDPELEQQVEQQLRELTLLPLNIKYLHVSEYQVHSAPEGIALVITPYATPLPLYSPPLIHAELPLQTHQQQRIRKLLES
ncbi:stationary phase inducible protein CsiE [Erwinia sp. P6884]|uniref:stationary phase inducible protein CsiE n=1 Tax=Erwinia sp. P6884 TaxID=3141450 RepID=UPI003189F6C3